MPSVRRVLSTALLLVVAIALLVAAPVDAERNFYKILGIDESATESQIKKAFRKLSLKYHPDKNQGDEKARQMFMDVNDANEVLSDPDKRSTYDLHGEEGLKKEKEQGNRPQGGLWDLFGGGGQQQGGKRKGPDYKMDFTVTLEDLYNGQTRTLKVARKVLCKSCKGSGAKGGQTSTCPHCQGKGQVMTMQSLGPGFNIQMATPCTHCSGKGKIAKHVCPICSGQRVKMEEKALDLVIERGMRDGQEINFPRASEQAPDMVPGDVIVTLRTQSHARFRRDGNNLHMEQTISLREALLGYSSSFAHMDGHRVSVVQEGITPPEFVKGEGMPHHEFASEKGDLFIKFHISFPRGLTSQQQDGQEHDEHARAPVAMHATAAHAPSS